jgi:hypothetical protein
VRVFDEAQIARHEVSLRLGGRTPTEVSVDRLRAASPSRAKAIVEVRPRAGSSNWEEPGWALALRVFFDARPAGRCVFAPAGAGRAGRVVVPVRRQAKSVHPWYPKVFDGRCSALLPRRRAHCEWTVRYVPAPGWGRSRLAYSFTVPGSRRMPVARPGQSPCGGRAPA